MKKRRGRRGFWWWSWLLALATIGGTVGGFFMGKKQWDEAPKEYLATARLSFHVRNPFVPAKSGVQITTSAVADENEAQVLREVKSASSLKAVGMKFDLSKSWGMNPADVVTKLRTGLELDLIKDLNELSVNVTLNDPQEAANVANAIATAIPDQIKKVDERNRAENMKQLEVEIQPFVDQEFEALAKLKKELQAKNYMIEPTPGVDLGNLLLVREILDAKVEWDAAIEVLESTRKGQAEYRNYWAKSVKPSFSVAEASVPPSFVGPPLKPFQSRWSVYGLTAGMLLGVLLMLICWKLFP